MGSHMGINGRIELGNTIVIEKSIYDDIMHLMHLCPKSSESRIKDIILNCYCSDCQEDKKQYFEIKKNYCRCNQCGTKFLPLKILEFQAKLVNFTR